MKTIRLYGALGKKFGTHFELDVKSPAEAVRALCCQIKGLRQYFETFSEPGYHIQVGEGYRDETELCDPCANVEEIRIIPLVAGGGGLAKVVIGIVLIAVAFIPGIGLPLALTLGAAGAGLVMYGLAGMLAQMPPGIDENAGPEATPSYLFNGPVNTLGPGQVVSVGYGELLVGSHVISAELFSVEEAI